MPRVEPPRNIALNSFLEQKDEGVESTVFLKYHKRLPAHHYCNHRVYPPHKRQLRHNVSAREGSANITPLAAGTTVAPACLPPKHVLIL